MQIEIPEIALIVFLGADGEETKPWIHQWIQRNFHESEVVTRDNCQSEETVELAAHAEGHPQRSDLEVVVTRRLRLGRLTVVRWEDDKTERTWLPLARRNYVEAIAIVFQDEAGGQQGARGFISTPSPASRSIEGKGFDQVFVIQPSQAADGAIVRRQLPVNREYLKGPFDIVGDVHGCASELEQLMVRLGYERFETPPASPMRYPWLFRHPDQRMAIFLGDLVDRGPRILDSYELVKTMVSAGEALCIPGNHDDKLKRKLKGRNVEVKNGLETTVAEIEALPPEIQADYHSEMLHFFESLPGYVVLDEEKLVAAHGGLKERMIGRATRRVYDFSLYGETTGKLDEEGLPVRINWAAHYRGKPFIVYGHTPVLEPLRQNQTLNIDTGCVYGGKLTALRYPEMELVSVPALRQYAQPSRPFLTLEKVNQMTSGKP